MNAGLLGLFSISTNKVRDEIVKRNADDDDRDDGDDAVDGEVEEVRTQISSYVINASSTAHGLGDLNPGLRP